MSVPILKEFVKLSLEIFSGVSYFGNWFLNDAYSVGFQKKISSENKDKIQNCFDIFLWQCYYNYTKEKHPFQKVDAPSLDVKFVLMDDAYPVVQTG